VNNDIKEAKKAYQAEIADLKKQKKEAMKNCLKKRGTSTRKKWRS
jgi:hypothetical protein